MGGTAGRYSNDGQRKQEQTMPMSRIYIIKGKIYHGLSYEESHQKTISISSIINSFRKRNPTFLKG